MRAAWRRAVALAASLLLAGCMTLDTRFNEGYRGPRTYSGVRSDLSLVKEAFLALNVPMMLVFMIDTPLCLVTDTLLLPLTLREERERRETRAIGQSFDREVPGPVRAVAAMPPAENARRLIDACGTLLAQLNPAATQCFSIDARIHRENGPTLSGREYKAELVTLLDRLHQRGGFLAFRDPSYVLVDEGVEVKAVFTSSIRKRAPVRLLAAPGADGDWRIVEAWLPEEPEPEPLVGPDR